MSARAGRGEPLLFSRGSHAEARTSADNQEEKWARPGRACALPWSSQWER